MTEEEEMPFKIGDRVIVTTISMTRRTGKEGIVDEILDDYLTYKVRVAFGESRECFAVDQIKLVKSADATPAVTDEQRAAVEWLQEVEAKTNGQNVRNHVRLLLDALPSELTNPQPVLPTEPGWYISEVLLAARFKREDGVWLDGPNGGGLTTAELLPLAPFTRLVPERPQITREEVARVLNLFHNTVDEQADAILALVNGADRD